jgi:hypothetical protein
MKAHIALFLAVSVFLGSACRGQEAPTVEETGIDLEIDGLRWLRTMTTPLDTSSEANRVATFKVYTHVYDFEGKEPITKGVGGKYTHHRGLFIGWNKTQTSGGGFDTWHMKDCYQAYDGALGGDAPNTQTFRVEWRKKDGTPLIDEIRSISARPAQDSLRIVDFSSQLISKSGDIQLRGDLHHAGMQIRMADEVVSHEDTTRYILPEGAVEKSGDEVPEAWWVCCSVEVGGKRYWIIHMTPPDHPTGIPVYSIRRYARFGAFFTPDLREGVPLDLKFRLVFSEKELDQTACQAVYDAYSKEQK